MIFVTVGTQKFPFDRLMRTLDELVCKKRITEDVFAQIGYSNYVPEHFKVKKLLTPEEFLEYMDCANVVITHGGTSSIIQALKRRKKVLVVPRRKKYKEHIDDHQVEIAQMFYESGMIEIVDDILCLGDLLEKIKQTDYKVYVENESKLINDLAFYLQQI